MLQYLMQLNSYNFISISSFTAAKGNIGRHNSAHKRIENWNIFL